MNKNKMSLDDFILVNQQSKSQSCLGFLSISKKDDSLYFIKKIPDQEKQNLIEHIAESELLNEDFMAHPNIIKCLEFSIRANSHHYFVYEYCELGNLLDFIKQYKSKFNCFPSQKIIQKIIKGIACAICKMHSENVMHRELKLKYIKFKYKNLKKIMVAHGKDKYFTMNTNEKITQIKSEEFTLFLKELPFKFKENLTIQEFEEFFDKNIQVKIIDLGSAKNFGAGEESMIFNSNLTMIKTDLASPEMNLNKKYGFESDMWPIGGIALFLLTGKCKNVFEGGKEEIEIERKFECSLELIDFINSLLQKDPKKRLTYKTILMHPFLYRNIETFTLKDFQRKINISNKKKNYELEEASEPIWNNMEMIEDIKTDINKITIHEEEIKPQTQENEMGYFMYCDDEEESTKENLEVENISDNNNENYKITFNDGITAKNYDIIEFIEDYYDKLYSRKIISAIINIK